jgi:hypothetical protein
MDMKRAWIVSLGQSSYVAAVSEVLDELGFGAEQFMNTSEASAASVWLRRSDEPDVVVVLITREPFDSELLRLAQARGRHRAIVLVHPSLPSGPPDVLRTIQLDSAEEWQQTLRDWLRSF